MIAPLLQGQNFLQHGQTNGVSCPLSIIADFTFPIFDGIKPIGTYQHTSVGALVCWHVGVLKCWHVDISSCLPMFFGDAARK